MAVRESLILRSISENMEIKMKFAITLLFLIFITCACNKNYLPLKTVDTVDIEKYSGLWYEIARLPNSFQENCYGATAEYEIIDETTIRVINSCFEDSLKGELDQATGKAFIEDLSQKAKLEVQFFWPFKGDYWIISLDQNNYNYAVVGTPSRKYLWILGRSKTFDKVILDSLVNYAGENKFDVSNLIYEPSIKLKN